MRIKLGNSFIEAEIAESFIAKALGLMFRPKLKPNAGMLFPFRHEDYLGMWMFGMRFPIDIIWISSSKKIVDIHENAKPWSLGVLNPKQKAKFVLEAEAGFCRGHNVKLGDEVAFITSSQC